MEIDVMKEMLRQLPRLRHLALPPTPNLMLEAVGRHCPHLRVFQASRTFPCYPVAHADLARGTDDASW